MPTRTAPSDRGVIATRRSDHTPPATVGTVVEVEKTLVEVDVELAVVGAATVGAGSVVAVPEMCTVPEWRTSALADTATATTATTPINAAVVRRGAGRARPRAGAGPQTPA